MAEGLSFAWGSRDCATLAAERVLALTGRDPLADLRGAYASAASAARIIAQEGGLVAAVDARIGWPRRPAAEAEVAVLAGDRGPVLAVREGAWWAMPSPGGVAYLRDTLADPLAAWGPA